MIDIDRDELMMCRGGPLNGRMVQVPEVVGELVICAGEKDVHYLRTDDHVTEGDSEFGVLDFEDSTR